MGRETYFPQLAILVRHNAKVVHAFEASTPFEKFEASTPFEKLPGTQITYRG
jgi:hypothetical protein